MDRRGFVQWNRICGGIVAAGGEEGEIRNRTVEMESECLRELIWCCVTEVAMVDGFGRYKNGKGRTKVEGLCKISQ